MIHLGKPKNKKEKNINRFSFSLFFMISIHLQDIPDTGSTYEALLTGMDPNLLHIYNI